MKKILGTALLLGGLFFVWKQISKNTSHENALSESDSQLKSSGKKAKELFGQALSQTEKQPEKKTQKEIPRACAEFWDYLTSQNIKQLTSLVERSEIKWDKECLKIKNSKLSQAALVIEKCINAFDLKECEMALTFYRAQVISQLYSQEKDPSRLESSVLMNLILSKFAGGEFSDGDLESLKNYSQELLKKEPGLYAAEKSYAGALFLEGIQKQGDKLEMNKELQEALERCRNANPNDLEIWEMSILPDLMKGNYQGAKNLADEIERKKPDSGLPNYYRAAILWKNKNKEGALSELKTAVSKEPENERYKTSLKKASEMTPGDAGAFSIVFNVSFNDI